MVLDGVLSNTELFRNFRVPKPLGSQLCHLTLPGSQFLLQFGYLVQHGKDVTLVRARITNGERLDFPYGVGVPGRNLRHQEKHLKIFSEAGEKCVVLILSRERQRLIQILRRLEHFADSQIAECKSTAHEVSGWRGNESRIKSQGGLYRGDCAFIFLLQQKIGDAAGFDHEIGEGQIRKRICLALGPERRASGFHHQSQQIPTYCLHHIIPQCLSPQEGIALSLVFKIVYGLLQSSHVRAINRVDPQQQRSAISSCGVA